jgi:hypothetical protein
MFASHLALRRATLSLGSTGAAALRTFATGGQMVKEMAITTPHKDVIRYEWKNQTFSLEHINFYSEALAVGITENGLTTGDVVLSWLPEHWSENVRDDSVKRMSL